MKENMTIINSTSSENSTVKTSDHFSGKGSVALPEEFVSRVRAILGDEYDEFAASYDREPRRGLRVNTLKIAVQEFMKLHMDESSAPVENGNDGCANADPESRFKLKPIPWCTSGFYYDEETRPGKNPLHEAGLYYIQEPSAMAVAEISGAIPGERILDLCAAPGGKTTALACMMKGEGLLISNEINASRARILSSNVERMGITNCIVTNESPESLALKFPSFFDRIIVDAPCSGEGMFLKEEQALTGWSTDNVKLCADRQQSIMECASKMLCEGGTIVYSTCTFAPEEDEGTVAHFLNDHRNYHVKDMMTDPGSFSNGNSAYLDTVSFDYDKTLAGELSRTIRLWPHKVEGEGHFIAVLKQDGTPSPKVCTDKIEKTDAAKLKLLHEFADDFLIAKHINAGLSKSQDPRIISFGEELYLIPDMLSLKRLKVLRPGLDLGTVKKDRFEPSHALALAAAWCGASNSEDEEEGGDSLHLIRSHAICACYSVDFAADEKRIIDYLKGGTLVLTDETARSAESISKIRGWALITVCGFPLGWAKASGGTFKNHYPKGLRWN